MRHVEEIGKRIKELRQRLNLSQQEFANLLGKSLRTVQRWEAGEVKRIPLTVLKHISEITGASLEWLQTGKGEPFSKTSKVQEPLDLDLLNFITEKVLEEYKKGNIPQTVDEFFLLDLIKLAYRKLKPLKDRKKQELALKELKIMWEKSS